MVVHLAVSYDTEQPIEPLPPAHIISADQYNLLGTKDKKEVWRTYLNDIWSDPELAARSLRELEMIAQLGELFAKKGGRLTSFVLGQWLDFVVDAFGEERVNSYFQGDNIEVGSHSYHHLPFKPTEHRVYEAITSREAFSEVRKANESIERHLRVKPRGLRTPMGNIRPFGDEDIEILSALQENGISYVSSWLKAAQCEPNSVGIAPFFYDQTGFPNLLEIPGVGPYDVHGTQPTRLLVFDDEKSWTKQERIDTYVRLLEQGLRISGDVFIPLVFHPGDVVNYDPQLEVHQELLSFAHQNGVKIVSYADIDSKFRG